MQKLNSATAFPSVLIGKGYWGSILTRYIKESPYFHLSKTFGSEFQIESLPKDCRCAFVATPLDSHFELCKELLSKRINVFVEKPTCRNLAEFEYLHSLSAQNKTILYTDYPYTLSPSIKHIKTLLLNHLKNLAQSPLKFKAKITQYGKFYENESALEVLGVHWLSVFALFFKEITPLKITTQTPSSYPLSICVKACAKFLESFESQNRVREFTDFRNQKMLNMCAERSRSGIHSRESDTFKGIKSAILDSQFKEKDFSIDLELTCSLECEEKARTLEISASNFSIYFDMLNSPKITFKTDSKQTQYFDFNETNTLAFCVQDFACAIKDKKHATKLLSLHRRVIRFLESCLTSLKSPLASESTTQSSETQTSEKGTL